MFILKKNYFLIIENIKDINLKNIKIRNKFSVIYRNKNKIDKISDLLRFRQLCKLKGISLFIANNLNLALLLKADGAYLSAFNNCLKSLHLKKPNFRIIGSAHNLKEIGIKHTQGCDLILFSKLFEVQYDKKAPFLGVIKFNNLLKINPNLIPLGGIKLNNLNNLKSVNSLGLALLSEIKKKPAKIFSRLF